MAGRGGLDLDGGAIHCYSGSMNPKVDAVLGKARKWREEMIELRAICQSAGLAEELKWGKPCYVFQDANVVIIQGFKDFCALLFCKGALLADVKGLLRRPGENTQAARRLEFTSLDEITGMEETVKAYLKEAIAVEKAGLEVEFKKPGDFEIPAELQAKLDAFPDFRKAFLALTPGRQRAYVLHFSSAKQSATRKSRVEKCIPRILEGRGLND